MLQIGTNQTKILKYTCTSLFGGDSLYHDNAIQLSVQHSDEYISIWWTSCKQPNSHQNIPKVEEKHDMSNLWSNYPAVDSDLVTGFGFLSTIPSPRFISLELERISFVMSWHKWELNKHTGNNIQQIYTLVILIHINTTLRFVAPSKSMADRLGVCKVCMCMRKINTKLSAGSSRKNFRHFTI